MTRRTDTEESRAYRALRRQAEEVLRDLPQGADEEQSRDQLIQEFRIHEIELRMQNEALREMQIELAAARERYRDLFQHAPVAYLVLGRDSSVIEANLAALGLLMLEYNELLGKRLSSLIEPVQAETLERHMRDALKSDATETCELTLRLPGGAERELRLHSVRDVLNPAQWRSALIDMAEVRQLQRSLERSQRLEAIGTFASGISHDFTNLLAVISGSADLALELLDPEDPSRPAVARARDAASRGRAVVRQLLRFASGPETDTTAVFNLDAAVKGAEQMIQQVIGSSVRLCTRLNAPSASVRLDLGGPEELLLNLAANAEHAMPNGGTLTIETSMVEANVALDRRMPRQLYALLSVSDTGVGMDAQTQARAFEPFFTTKSRAHGTGLGLAMVYGIVKRAGGHIQLQSAPRQGTTFRIYLPVKDPHGRRS